MSLPVVTGRQPGDIEVYDNVIDSFVWVNPSALVVNKRDVHQTPTSIITVTMYNNNRYTHNAINEFQATSIQVFDDKTYTETVINPHDHTVTKVEYQNVAGKRYRITVYDSRYTEQVEY